MVSSSFTTSERGATMNPLLILACFTLSLGFVGPVAGQDLLDVLADQYLLEAMKALKKGKPGKAIQIFEKIEALDTKPPMEFLYFYGKAMIENDRADTYDLRKGEALLKQFILNIEKKKWIYR